MVSPATDARHPAQAWSGSGQLQRPARRIMSLLPSATEIVCALRLVDGAEVLSAILAGTPDPRAVRLPAAAAR